MSLVRDQALVLKRFPFSESSLVVHVATRAHGRVHLIAKGAYRPTSRYYAILDVFDTLEIEWHRQPHRELSILRSGSVSVRRRTLSSDLDRYRSALSMLELADIAFRPEHADPRLFGLLTRSLEHLALERDPADLSLVVFELEFLHNLGLAPALVTCAACAGPAEPAQPGGKQGSRVAFSAGAGGRLCRTCAIDARASGRRVGTLPLDVLDDACKLWSRGIGRDDATAEASENDDRRAGVAYGLAQQRLDRVRDFVGRFLDYHLETRPRTQRRFLARPNRNAPLASAESH